MCSVDRIHGDIAGNVRPPPSLKRRAPIACLPRSGNNEHITVEDRGFVSSIQRHTTRDVLDEHIQQLSIARVFCRALFSGKLVDLLVGKRFVHLRKPYVVEPQGF